MNFGITSKTLMILAALLLSKGIALAPESDISVLSGNTNTLPVIRSMSETELNNFKNYVNTEISEITVSEALVSLINDARHLCGHSNRCALLFGGRTEENSIETNATIYEDANDSYITKLLELGVDTNLVDSYALSLPDTSDKARIVAIIESGKGYEILNIFREYQNKMIEQFGQNATEQTIAKNAQIGKIGEFSYIVMSPHSAQSSDVIRTGLKLITTLGII